MSLELINLEAKVDGLTLFEGLSATIAEGETVAVMGPSGSGKTTLLNIIAGFASPPIRWSGDLRLDGQAISNQPPERRRLGLVFQTPLLFPHLSVRSNLLYGRRFAPAARRRTSFDQVVDLMASMSCWPAGPQRCPAVSASVSRSAAPCWPSPTCC